jgi:short-subunit dehydrogenase
LRRSSRSREKLEHVANEIISNGGAVETFTVDALDEQAVNAFVNAVIQRAATIDISINVIGYGDVQENLCNVRNESVRWQSGNSSASSCLRW